MVEAETLEKAFEVINEKLGGTYKIGIINLPEDVVFLEENAHFFTPDVFKNLVGNVKKDKQLASVPLCIKLKNGKYKVLSGNHRVQAGIESGLKSILVLYTDEELSEGKQIAIQLSHNAIIGKDDLDILKRLFDKIDSVGDKMYAGLDDKTLQAMEKASLSALSEVPLDFTTTTIMFLPDEVERVEELVDTVAKSIPKGHVWTARMKDYERFASSIQKIRESYQVKNTAVCFMVMIDIFERHMTELIEGLEFLPEGRGRTMPIESLFGTGSVSAETAFKVSEYMKTMGEETPTLDAIILRGVLRGE